MQFLNYHKERKRGIMDRVEKYLEEVNGYLKSLSLSERTDIISEIKSHISERQVHEGISQQEILENLGSSKNLARGYIGERISQNKRFRLKELFRAITFYSATGLTGAFVVPFLAGCSIVFYLSAFFIPALGILNFFNYVLKVGLPLVAFVIGPNLQLHPFVALPVSIVMGIGFYFLSKYLWKKLKVYLAYVSKKYRKLLG